MEISNQLVFEAQFHTEDQALAAAFLIGDLLEEHEKVEKWSINCEVCPDCGNHAVMKGELETFFPGRDMMDVGLFFSNHVQVMEGFIVGDMGAVVDDDGKGVYDQEKEDPLD